MKHFRRFLTLLIVLIIVSTMSGVYSFSSIATDNKSLDINSQSISNNALTTVKTIYVNITGNDKNDGLTPKKPKKTIQNAINTAKPGDTIKVASGTYKENLKINKNLKIIGHNQKDTIIDGAQKSYCIYIDNNRKISISGFTIKNGKTTERWLGGSIENRGLLDLKNVKITNNTAIENGGGIRNAGVLDISNSTVTGNTAGIDGGGIYNIGDRITMNNVVINNNKALRGAGICSNGAMFIYTSIIKNNTAIEDGGGIWNQAVLDLVNSTITYNKAKIGGGISNYGLINLDVETGMGTSNIINNIAKEKGGGIYNYATIYGDGRAIIENNKPNNIEGDPIKPYP